MSTNPLTDLTFRNPTSINNNLFNSLSDAGQVATVFKMYVLQQNDLHALDALLRDPECLLDHSVSFLKNLNMFHPDHQVIADRIIKAMTREFTDEAIKEIVNEHIPSYNNRVDQLLREAHQEKRVADAQKHLPDPSNVMASLQMILSAPYLLNQKLNDPEFVYLFGKDLLIATSYLQESVRAHEIIGLVIQTFYAKTLPEQHEDLSQAIQAMPDSYWRAYVLLALKRYAPNQ